MSQIRQLAAIMFTDIVGYIALMGNDEEKAFSILSKNRALQKPIIEQFNGRWIKEPGDRVMASFNTVSDAVNAAIKIQEVEAKNDHHFAFHLAECFAVIEEKALDLLEYSMEIFFPYIFLSRNILFENIKDEERFKNLMKAGAQKSAAFNI